MQKLIAQLEKGFQIVNNECMENHYRKNGNASRLESMGFL